jgi:hypothetical protein
MEKIKKPRIRSEVNNSEAFGAIMEKYNLLGRSMSVRSFYTEYVKPMDQNITYRMWDYYIRRLRKNVVLRSEEITNKITDNLATETSMENSAMRKLLAIGDLTLDKFIEQPELLSTIPLDQRVQWIFNAMKARDSRMIATAKVLGEKRKTSMYEDMLIGAQYGAIEAEDVSDSQNNKKTVIDAPTAKEEPKTASKKAEVEFNPAEFDKQYAD